MKRKIITKSISLTQEMALDLETTSKERGMTVSGLAREAIEFYLGFDEDFIDLLNKHSKELRVMPGWLIRDIEDDLIEKWARPKNE